LSEVTLTDYVSTGQKIVEPKTYAQAVDPSNNFHWEWHSATEKELNSLTENNILTLVPMPLNKCVICCLWIFKIKRDSIARVLKLKARVCARGDQHTHEIDYNETFAPVL
jgi:hypothetical protein